MIPFQFVTYIFSCERLSFWSAESVWIWVWLATSPISCWPNPHLYWLKPYFTYGKYTAIEDRWYQFSLDGSTPVIPSFVWGTSFKILLNNSYVCVKTWVQVQPVVKYLDPAYDGVFWAVCWCSWKWFKHVETLIHTPRYTLLMMCNCSSTV